MIQKSEDIKPVETKMLADAQGTPLADVIKYCLSKSGTPVTHTIGWEERGKL